MNKHTQEDEENYFNNEEDQIDTHDQENLFEIISFLKLHPNGISQERLFSEMKIESKSLVNSLNILFQQGRLVNESTKQGSIFKLLTEKEILKMKDLSADESHVYEVIISSGNNGITLNELKSTVGLTGNALSKIRKKLERKLLIKNLTVPNMKNKKVILGYDIEPSNELKGGFWCTNQHFDKGLIETISGKIIEYLSNQRYSLRKEILVYIKSTGLVSGDIKEEDLQSILNLLVFDDKIDILNFEEFGLDSKGKYIPLLGKKNEMTVSISHILSNLKYKIQVNYFQDLDILQSVPCTYCPNIKFCDVGNVITPVKCPYLLDMYNDKYDIEF